MKAESVARRGVRRGVVGGLVLAGAWLAGCNLVLGLDDYTKGFDTVGEGGVPDATSAEAGSDARTDALVETDAGTPPVTWAPWPMPNWVSDAGFPTAPPPASVQAPAGPSYEDTGTRLVWFATDQTLRTHDAAAAACRAKGGRLPRRIELVTLLDLEASPKSRLPPGVMADAAYWTSSRVRPLEGAPRYWVVDFGRGEVTRKGAGPNETAIALCLLGEDS